MSGKLRLLSILLCTLAPAISHARCSVAGEFSHHIEALVHEIEDCFNREIKRLENKIARLERTVAKFQDLIEAQPVTYENRDGQIEVEENRPIGNAVFLLSSRQTGGASTLPLDPRIVEAVCGVSHCALTLRLRRLKLIGAGEGKVDTVGPCSLLYDQQTGDWSLGAGCSLANSVSGRDGDGKVPSDAGPYGFLVSAGGACNLSERDVSTFGGDDLNLARDHTKGLFLLSVPDLQPEGAARYECELELRS